MNIVDEETRLLLPSQRKQLAIVEIQISAWQGRPSKRSSDELSKSKSPSESALVSRDAFMLAMNADYWVQLNDRMRKREPNGILQGAAKP